MQYNTIFSSLLIVFTPIIIIFSPALPWKITAFVINYYRIVTCKSWHLLTLHLNPDLCNSWVCTNFNNFRKAKYDGKINQSYNWSSQFGEKNCFFLILSWKSTKTEIRYVNCISEKKILTVLCTNANHCIEW